jgi:hypothetical protein
LFHNFRVTLPKNQLCDEPRQRFQRYNCSAIIASTRVTRSLKNKETAMKKILITGAILSLLSTQVFAQDANGTAAGQTGAAAGQTGAAAGEGGAAAGAATGGGFLAPAAALTGLAPGALVAIGAAVAGIATMASDNGSSTQHSTTTHH